MGRRLAALMLFATVARAEPGRLVVSAKGQGGERVYVVVATLSRGYEYNKLGSRAGNPITFEHVPPGEYELTVAAFGHDPVTQLVVVSGSESRIEVTLLEEQPPPPAQEAPRTRRSVGSLEIAFRDHDGGPIENMPSVVSLRDGGVFTSRPTPCVLTLGGFSNDLEPGPYAFDIQFDERRPIHREFNVVEGRTTRLEIGLEVDESFRVERSVVRGSDPAGCPKESSVTFGTDFSFLGTWLNEPPTLRSIAGRVVDPDGTPIPKFEIDSHHVCSADGRFSGRIRTGSSQIDADGYWEEPVPQRAEFTEVILRPRLPFIGTVVDADGHPAQGATVWSTTPDRSTTTNQFGEFELLEDSNVLFATLGGRWASVTWDARWRARLTLQEGTWVRGRVISKSGTAPPPSIATWNHLDYREHRTAIAPDGTFEFQLRPDDWHFVIPGTTTRRTFAIEGENTELIIDRSRTDLDEAR